MSDSLSDWVPHGAKIAPAQAVSPSQSPASPSQTDVQTDLSNWKPAVAKTVGTAPPVSALPPAEEPSTSQIVGSGAVTGAAQILGMPADFTAGAINAVTGNARATWSDIIHPLDTLEGLIPGIGEEAAKRSLERQKAILETPTIEHMPSGSEWWNQKMTEAGLPTTETVQPTTTGGKLLQQAIRGAIAFAGPGTIGRIATARGLPALGQSLETLAPGSLRSNAVIGATSGAVGEAAAEAEPHSPMARMVGEIAGGAGAGGAGAAAGAARRLVPPMTMAAREAAAPPMAAEAFRTSAIDPNAAMAQLHALAASLNREIVPGSVPTTAEALNDPGLLALQRARERLPPEQSELGNAVREQQVQNNEARVRSLQGMAPITASPEATQSYLQRQLQDIDNMHAASIDAARENAETAHVEPSMAPEEQAAAIRQAVEEQRAPQTQALTEQEAAARQTATEATEALPGIAAAGTPEERAMAPGAYGARIRDPVQQAYLAERARLSQMREAIDPTGTMGMSSAPIKAARVAVEQGFHPDTFGGMENKFYDRIDGWGDLIPIEDAARLRADINARLRNVPDHSPQEALRLQTVKKGIDQAFQEAASDARGQENAGTINQGMPPLDARVAEIENRYGIGPNFARDVAAAYSPTARRIANRDEVGRGVLETADQENVGARTGDIPPGAGGGSQENGGRGGGPVDQGVPPGAVPDLTPLTPEAQQRFAQWNRDYAEMSKAYRGETGGKLHAVGQILQKGGAYDAYRIPDEQVPSVFVDGKNARLAAERLLEVAPEETAAALDDALGFSLRRAAQNENGTLNLAAYRKWLDSHNGVISLRPELAERFNTASQAQQRLEEIQQNLREHNDAHPLNPGWGSTQLLKRFWRSGPEGAESMKQFIEMTGSSPEAMNAIADYAALDFANRPGIIRNGEIVPKAADLWISQHQGAMSAVPGLRERFASAADAQREVERAVAAHLDARDEFTKSVAGAFMQDDPERAVARLFTGADRGQKAEALMNVVEHNPAAREGLQRATIDYILGKFSGAPVAGSETAALMPQRLQNFIAENRDVLNILFPGGLAKNFDALAEDLRRSQLKTASKMPGGSDTAELVARSRHGTEGGGIGTIAAAVIGEHAGQHIFGHLLGGPTGLTVGAVGSRIFRAQKQALQTAANRVLDQMLLSPEYAFEVLNAPKSPLLMQRLGQRVAQTVIQAARSEDLQPPKKPGMAHGGRVEVAASRAEPEPSDAQKEAGNYRKGHIVIEGIPITIENARGSIRRGIGHGTKPWAVRMPCAYGYFKKSEGMDGEHVDTYIGPNPDSHRVFVIDQVDADTKRPDEHKVMLGFPNRSIALANYRKAFSDGRGGDRIGAVTEMGIDELKNWLKDGDTDRPMAA